jgi:hypothetical protein
MATKKSEIMVEVAPISIKTVNITLVGTTPLIVHNWSVKAKQMLLDKQTHKTVTKSREAKDPFADYVDTLYWMSEEIEDKTEENFALALKNGARFGFPVTGIKQAAIAGSYRAGAIKDMASARGAFFIEGENCGAFQLAEIKGVPNMREDMVRVGMGAADIRYRAEFREWSIPLTIRYNSGAKFTIEQIVNLFNIGGFSCGIGEWRPEKDGQNGMFVVAA